MHSRITTSKSKPVSFQVFLVLLFICHNIGSIKADQKQTEVLSLEPGKPIERKLKGPLIQAYQITIDGNMFLKLTLEQHGIDVTLLLFDPDGKKLIETNAPNGAKGLKRISWVTDRAGNYRLEIHPLKVTTIGGLYKIELTELRNATARDQQRINNRKQLDEGLVKGKPEDLVGQSAPQIFVKDLKNEEYEMAKLRGKIVVLNYWATWCGPCRTEMPDLESLYNNQQKNDVIVLGISNEDSAVVSQFIRESKFTFPILIDEWLEAMVNYKIRIFPTTIILSPDGTIAYAYTGIQTKATLQKAINSLLLKKVNQPR